MSVSFSLSPSVERLFQLGSFDAFDTQIQTQESISLSNYGGASTPVTLIPNSTCADSTARMDVTITPAPCTGSAIPISRTGSLGLFINSYSYSKDFQGFGQESWSLQGKPNIPGFTGNLAFIQGFSEGSHTIGTDVVSDDGIVLTGSIPATSLDATGRDLSVSAGSSSLGQDDTQVFGKITRVGGAVGQENGKRGTSSATIPHQLIFF